MKRILQTALVTTAVAGTLDLISAFVFSAMDGGSPAAVLRTVASGPFGNEMRTSGATGAMIGAATHFTLMFVMALTYVSIASRWELPVRRPAVAGAVYGLILYLIMYWIVLPMRWPAIFPNSTIWGMGNALFSHIVCVGLPIAFIATAMLRRFPRPG